MASDAQVIPPPPGFKLDAPAAPPPPPGFKLDAPSTQASPPAAPPSGAPRPIPATAATGAPTTRIIVRPEDAEDRGYFAETGRAAAAGLEKLTASREQGAIAGPMSTLGKVAGGLEFLGSPIEGAIRSFGGRGLNLAERALRYPATKIYGEDKVPKAPTFEESAGQAERLSMVAPVVGMAPQRGAVSALSAARNAAKVIEKIFSPETVDLNAKKAVAMIREFTGQAARETAQTAASIEGGWKKVNTMPDADRLDFISYIEGRSGRFAGTQMADPELQALADTLRTAFEQRMNKLQAMPKYQQMSFIQDYFPHFWKEPGAAANTVPKQAAGTGSRTGSGASLKARTIPTIGDGLAQGLTPVTTDPLEATMRYVTSMDRFIAQQEVFETALNAGDIKFIQPKTMGASGHPDSFKVPDGWKPLEGRGSTNAQGHKAYAPEGFARIYNNWISRGIHDVSEDLGAGYEGLRKAGNLITASELSFSGYHALTMMQESSVNAVANAIGYARAGKPIEAVKSLGKAGVAPVRSAMVGKKVQDIYLGLSQGSREMQQVTDLLTAAGGRAKGAQHAPDYNFSKTGSYWTAFRRGALRGQLAADRAEMAGQPITGTAKVAFRHIGRIADTVAQPIFEKYIPLLKNGAFYENMSAWLKANPTASREEQVNAARQVWDSIDNRFGELVQDNIFMNQLVKQMGMLSLRSWSWFIGGDVRELGGAVRDVARAPFKRTTGTGPQDVRWTQKMDYAIALPMVYGTLAALYQGLKTGEPPKDMQDLVAPRTGGVDAATGQPERLIMPGYMKDVFGFIEHPAQEVTNKIATGPRMASEVIQNQDWRGDPIVPGAGVPNAPNWLQAYWNYATQELGPISVRNLAKGQKAGSNLSAVEQALGVRTAPRQLTDPEGFEKMMKTINTRKWKTKQSYERKQQRLYEGE